MCLDHRRKVQIPQGPTTESIVTDTQLATDRLGSSDTNLHPLRPMHFATARRMLSTFSTSVYADKEQDVTLVRRHCMVCERRPASVGQPWLYDWVSPPTVIEPPKRSAHFRSQVHDEGVRLRVPPPLTRAAEAGKVSGVYSMKLQWGGCYMGIFRPPICITSPSMSTTSAFNDRLLLTCKLSLGLGILHCSTCIDDVDSYAPPGRWSFVQAGAGCKTSPTLARRTPATFWNIVMQILAMGKDP